jgi:hypothetical protein
MEENEYADCPQFSLALVLVSAAENVGAATDCFSA